ncbi:MAG: hypothetical protein QM504_07170 [Pseudomonadota bacterium]
MVSFSELYTQNHKITELSKVLLHIINDRSLCDTDVTCDMFFDYTTKVKAHLDQEERELYRDLLTHSDKEVKATATKYLSGSAEIKHVLKDYLKHWCRNKNLRIKDHTKFVKESEDIFNLINDRISDEVENFYPMVRDIYGTKMAA